MSRHCYNRFCNKELREEDFPVLGIIEKPLDLGEYHLCQDCWNRFDGQKMRGRWRSAGISHEELVRLGAEMDQLGGCPFTIGHPSEELRYTESLTQWVEWQNPDKSLLG